MHYVYVLQSKTNLSWFYVGRTDDLRKRFQLHNSKRVKSTKGYAPFVLVYYEAYRDKKDSTKREIDLKSHYSKDRLKNRLSHSVIV